MMVINCRTSGLNERARRGTLNELFHKLNERELPHTRAWDDESTGRRGGRWQETPPYSLPYNFHSISD